VEVDRMPSQEAFSRFLTMLGTGHNKVVLKTPEGDVTVADDASLSPADSGSVSMVLGGARVSYAPESVAPEVVTSGLVF